jgi:hypothetical protein
MALIRVNFQTTIKDGVIDIDANVALTAAAATGLVRQLFC